MSPILNRKNVDKTTITNINNVILSIIGIDFPHITIMKSFEVRDYMFLMVFILVTEKVTSPNKAYTIRNENH